MAAAHREGTASTSFAQAMDALSEAVGAGPQGWNDRPERTADDVVDALGEAIRMLGRRTGSAA